MEEAVTLAESMDARGHGRGRRSRYRPAHWTPAAVVVSATSVVAAGVFVVAAWTQRGDLHPATSPLAWPQVQPALLAAIGLLAIPAFAPRPREEP